jgi:hypothetical protein
MPENMEVCPNCGYTLLEKRAYCPYCGAQIGHPFWKKIAAWLLLVLIGYGLVTCHLRLMDGFPEAGAKRGPGGPQQGADISDSLALSCEPA